jgi:hypothetical protein
VHDIKLAKLQSGAQCQPAHPSKPIDSNTR